MKVMVRTSSAGAVVDARPYDPTCPDVCWSSGEWSVQEHKEGVTGVLAEAALVEVAVEDRPVEDRLAELEARVAKLEEGAPRG